MPRVTELMKRSRSSRGNFLRSAAPCGSTESPASPLCFRTRLRFLGQGADAAPVILRINDRGELEEVSLKDVAFGKATLPNASNEGDTRNFARANVRRIKAETFLDCISQVTEMKNKFPGLPLGARAVQIADGGISNTARFVRFA